MLSNNPLAMEQYKLTNAESTNRSSGFTIQNIITNELNRIDYLRTIPMAEKDTSELRIVSAIKYGLRSIESKLYPFIYKDEDYQTKIKPIKEAIRTSDHVTKSMELLSDWEDLLISKLGLIDMLPQQNKEFEFE